MTPADPDDIKQAAHQATALAIDAPASEPIFDPEVGERALLACRASLLALSPGEVVAPFLDPIQAGAVALSLAEVVGAPGYREAFAQMPEVAMCGASAEALATLAHALFYLETRTRTKVATTPRIRLPRRLVRQAFALRAKMALVIEYVIVDDDTMRAEVADIRARGKHADLAADLGRVASHYSTRRAELARDVIRYDPEDETRARVLMREILQALSAPKDNSLNDLRNRAFTCVVQMYTRLRLAAQLIYLQRPVDLERFPSLRVAVAALGRRARAAASAPASPDSPASATEAPPTDGAPAISPARDEPTER